MLKTQVTALMKRARFDWSFPSDVELQTDRHDYRNMYGYSVDWLKIHDIFGERRHQKGEDTSTNNKMQITGGGQLNIMTTGSNKIDSVKEF